ncbi:unnamed protein product, partial [Polarella glacialis]
KQAVDHAVRFSDSRFLRRVLLEAQRGNLQDATTQKLTGMGFGPEVVQVALHVAGGDEKRALQLCMSGLAFVGGGDEAPLEDCAPPAPLRCYICGQRHLTDKSLDIHLKACRRRFELREAKRPLGERRPLLEESELPEGADSLERHYEAVPSDTQKMRAAMPFEDWFAKQREVSEAKLLPCEFCKRTFVAERLEVHQRVCLQQPRLDPTAAASSAASRRRSLCPSSPTAPPAAAVRAFESFCHQLERCPGCSRQFRPELLQVHQKGCCAAKVAAKPRRPPPSWGAGVLSPSRRSAVNDSGAGGAAQATGSPTAVRRSRSSGSLASASFTPPSRYPAAGSPQSASSTASAAATSPAADLSSSAVLLERGLITRASEEDEALLRDELAERLGSGVELVGVFQVVNAIQKGVYDALRNTLQELRERQPLEEQELWHGTSWTFVPKILRQGFNRSFAGRHGTLLGTATYFSSDVAYSLRFCDRRGGGQDGTKVLLKASVLVGNYCKGCSSDVEPPIMDAETGERFDSTVDNEEKPSIFAVFRDFQALPLFLLEVKNQTARAS